MKKQKKKLNVLGREKKKVRQKYTDQSKINRSPELKGIYLV